MAANDTDPISDVELLKRQIGTLWTVDDVGRIRGTDDVVIAASTCGHALAIGSKLPDALTKDLQRIVLSVAIGSDPAAPPACLERCEALLRDAVGEVHLSARPSYLIPPEVIYESTVVMERSAPATLEPVAGPGPTSWSMEVGEELHSGAVWALTHSCRVGSRQRVSLRGPWAIATCEGQPISISHTAAWSSHGAEIQVWTHPAFRGRGYGSAVTAAWANLAASSGRHLFYSTDATNLASQRVAARLNLRPIGWIWKLSRTT